MTSDRVSLVTGATSGIGLATAIALARKGDRLCITGPDSTAVDLALKQLPSGTFSVVGDLGDADFVPELAQQAERHFGRVDLLINNAAWRELLTMRQIGLASWDRTLRVCLTAPAFLARQLAVGMEARGSGLIVNVSSIMAGRGFGGATAYVAAKAGLDAVTRDLAVLYGASGVRVIGVAPGAVDTALSANYTRDGAGAATDDVRAFSEAMIPAGRWATAAEIAQAIVTLSSSELGYLNGTTVSLDGGWSATLYPRPLRERFGRGDLP